MPSNGWPTENKMLLLGAPSLMKCQSFFKYFYFFILIFKNVFSLFLSLSRTCPLYMNYDSWLFMFLRDSWVWEWVNSVSIAFSCVLSWVFFLLFILSCFDLIVFLSVLFFYYTIRNLFPFYWETERGWGGSKEPRRE